MSRVRFTQQGHQNEELAPGRDDTTMKCTYYTCGKLVHMSLNCPETDRCRGGSGRITTGILQIRVDFTQLGDMNTININWTLLDTYYTASVGNNLDLVRTVQDCTEYEPRRSSDL